MPDYKAMYFKQFRANAKAMEILRQATLETEQMAMQAKEPLLLRTGPQPKHKLHRRRRMLDETAANVIK